MLHHRNVWNLWKFLTLTVLFKRKRWTSVNILIGIMSVSDLCVISFVASATLQSYLSQRLYTYEATTYLRHTFMTSSYVCAMIIGCERSFAVRSPLKFRETWNTELTLKLYAVCYIIFLAFVLSRSVISKLTNVVYFEAYFYVPFFFDCQRSSVCCYPGSKHPCHPDY